MVVFDGKLHTFNFIATNENSITPSCFPKNKLAKIATAIGCDSEFKDKFSIEIPEFKNAKIGNMTNETHGWSSCSSFFRGVVESIFNGIKDPSNIPDIVECIPDFKIHSHNIKPTIK